LEFAFDFLFAVLAFGGSLSLAVKCNNTDSAFGGFGTKLCDLFPDHSNKAGTSAPVCGTGHWIPSFLLCVSTFLDVNLNVHSANHESL
jgi:hypothetical protein